jgi:hypothetical protein
MDRVYRKASHKYQETCQNVQTRQNGSTSERKYSRVCSIKVSDGRAPTRRECVKEIRNDSFKNPKRFVTVPDAKERKTLHGSGAPVNYQAYR